MRPVKPNGPRGLLMVLLGLSTVLLGFIYLSPLDYEVLPVAVNAMFLPVQVWGCLWIAVGAAVTVYGFRKDPAAGLATSVAMNFIWTLIHLASFIYMIAAEHTLKFGVGTLYFAGTTISVVCIARMINPIDIEDARTDINEARKAKEDDAS